MKKAILSFFLVYCFSFSFTQVLRGKVTDIQTSDPIWYASVYFNGTFIGTTTDESGNFILDISRMQSRPVTISAIGYYSETVTIDSAITPLIVTLKPKVYDA